MTKREPLYTSEHFEEFIASSEEFIVKMHSKLSDVTSKNYKIDAIYYDIYTENKDLLTAKYSAGYPIGDLRYHTEELINWFLKYEEHPDHEVFFITEFHQFANFMQLASLAVIFNTDKAKLKRLFDLIIPQGEDALLDKIALTFQPNRKRENKLQHPKAYQPLFDVINAAKDEQPKLMQKFLKGWYKSMRKCGWHDIHVGGVNGNFTGYWCWEAAMVTLLYNIDDSSYRDMPFYPKDMVEYAKQQKL